MPIKPRLSWEPCSLISHGSAPRPAACPYSPSTLSETVAPSGLKGESVNHLGDLTLKARGAKIMTGCHHLASFTSASRVSLSDQDAS